MSTYESVGTVRHKRTVPNGMKAIFVPDGDHEVKHGDKRYAIFLPEAGGSDKPIHRPIDDDGVEISILSEDEIIKEVKESTLTVAKIAIMASVLSASDNQTKVMVMVEDASGSLKLTGITPPPK